MKRSEVNSYIRWAEKFLADNNIRLPELAYWTPSELKAREASLATVRRLELGWDTMPPPTAAFAKTGLLRHIEPGEKVETKLRVRIRS